LIRVISTWGNIRFAGLTEVQIFDREGEKIQVHPSQFFLRGGPLSSVEGIEKIVNGVTESNAEKNMWFTYMPEPPKCLEIGIRLEKCELKEIGFIFIWNYNKSLIESVKGVKEIEILWENQLIFEGTVKRGNGKLDNEYKTVIRIDNSVDIQKIY
jgi:protein JBTS26